MNARKVLSTQTKHRQARWRGQVGMTLLELIITASIILTLAAVAMPLSKMTQKRSQELELRQTLRKTREAIDLFYDHWNRAAGPYCKKYPLTCAEISSEFGYPNSLEVLVEGAPLGGVSEKRKKYLRRIPVDPITKEATWQIRCYTDGPDAFISCDQDVYDISSTSDAVALDGTPYRSW